MSKFYISQDIFPDEILSAAEGIYGLKDALVYPNAVPVKFNKFISVVYGCIDNGCTTIRFKNIIPGNRYWVTCKSLIIDDKTMTISNGQEELTINLDNIKWMILWSVCPTSDL